MRCLFVTALMEEAKPIRDRLKLKRQSLPGKLSFYTDGAISLLITGIGRAMASIQLARLLQQHADNPYLHIINLGIAGCENPTVPLGTTCLVNKITEHSTSRIYITDRLYPTTFPETELVTVDQPKANRTTNDPILYDMEASGIFQAATQFVTADRIHFIKVVSDHLDGKFPTKAKIHNLVQDNLDPILEYVRSLPGNQIQPTLTQEELEALGHIQASWKLTQTQTHQLKDAAIHFKLSRVGESLINVLTNLDTDVPTNKAERSVTFQKLREALLV